ncbi:MAG: hypothetical protein F2836_02170 [Actinobacteria bacterium]|uniref:Unannotated protein n=1 Tax=freshwater metagenome TaxID=449393 RepID=A0A6J7I465_9ZZZZ|nr:hypothetical protein [Actinomycetota bacterium]
MLNSIRDSQSLVVPRRVGVLIVWGAVIGLLGTLTSDIAGFGLVNLRVTWLDLVPWVALVAMGAIAALASIRWGSALIEGAALLASAFVGPSLVISIVELDWALKSSGDSLTLVAFDDPTEAFSRVLQIIGGCLVIVSGIAVLAAVAAVLLRQARVRPDQIPKTPFRLEALGATLAFATVAIVTVLAVGAGSFPRDMSATFWVGWISWFVPVTLALALGLRRSGLGSMWVAAAALFVFVLEPIVRTLALNAFEGLGWVGDMSGWMQPSWLLASRSAAPIETTQAIMLPVLAIAAIVLLWNSTPQQAPRAEGRYELAAPLEPWAATALVLSFVPILSVPAIVLGHVSYERIAALGVAYRGRMIAATAIILGILNLTIVFLFFAGALQSVTTLVGRG